MASIWTQGPGTPPRKLKGNMPADLGLVRSKLSKYARDMAQRNGAKIVLVKPLEVHLQWPDGLRFTVWAELMSPPSADEPGQPKRREISQ